MENQFRDFPVPPAFDDGLPRSLEEILQAVDFDLFPCKIFGVDTFIRILLRIMDIAAQYVGKDPAALPAVRPDEFDRHGKFLALYVLHIGVVRIDGIKDKGRFPHFHFRGILCLPGPAQHHVDRFDPAVGHAEDHRIEDLHRLRHRGQGRQVLVFLIVLAETEAFAEARAVFAGAFGLLLEGLLPCFLGLARCQHRSRRSLRRGRRGRGSRFCQGRGGECRSKCQRPGKHLFFMLSPPFLSHC